MFDMGKCKAVNLGMKLGRFSVNFAVDVYEEHVDLFVQM
jgi:hypothetical protein